MLRETFQDILRKRRIRTVYQPIFDLNTMELHGHEALTRGPIETAFESPELLFQFAGDHEAIWELEQLCIESSATHYVAHPDCNLFINVEADSITALTTKKETLEPLLRLRHRVVIEVTERSAIGDIPVFREALAALRDKGFRIAIDDAGSGYASLQSIAELYRSESTAIKGLAFWRGVTQALTTSETNGVTVGLQSFKANVGDGAFAFELTYLKAGKPLAYVGDVVFRTGDLLGAVFVTATDDAGLRARTVGLADKLEVRMRQVVAGRIPG